jgi:hypothetical protein
MYQQSDLSKIAKILESPLLWAEAILKDPESGEPFVANYVERLVLGSNEKRVVIRVHRRAGKSYSLAILSLWACMVHKYYDVLIACPDDDKVSELFETIEAFINSTPVVLDALAEKTKSPHVIRFKNGSTIKGKTTGAASKREGTSLRGKGANLVIIDEAAYLAEGDFKALNPIILGDKYKTSEGKVIRTFAASTPTEQHGRYYQWCFLPGTSVTIGNSTVRNIEDIKVGDVVIAGDGSLDTVVKTFVHESSDNLISLIVSSTPHSLVATSEHPVWTDKGYVPIKEISPGNRVGFCIVKEQDIPMEYPVVANSKIIETIDKYNSSDQDYRHYLAKLLGYYLSIGKSTTEGVVFTGELKQIQDVYYIVSKLFQDVLVKMKVVDSKTAVLVYSQWFKDLMEYLGKDNKIHPAIFLSKHAKATIRAYKKTYTTSKELCDQIQQVMLRSGIACSVYKTDTAYYLGKSSDIIKDGYFYVKVLSSSIKNYSGKVYNFETQSHSYVANGFSVHNCHDTTGEWHQIHVPVTENPDYTEEEVNERKALSTEVEWITEQLAEFLDSGMNAFKNSDIDAAMGNYRYMDKGSIRSGVYRAMGVDWDKYQAGVNICIVEWLPGQPKYKVIYREEVPRGEYTLTTGVERIIALNDAFAPDYIYVDRGYGEHAVEQLKIYGKNNPGSKLYEKLKGFNFNENVTIKDPIDGTPIKKQFKAVMLNTLFKLFEDKNFEFSTYDRAFETQLRNYKVIEAGANTIKTTRSNEHIIDACGLACYAIYSNHSDNTKFIPASISYSMPAPKVVPSKITIASNRELFDNMQAAFTDKRVYKNLGRGSFLGREPERTKF